MIRLHLFDLDRPPTPLAALSAHLGDDERERAGRFRRSRDRDRFVAGRGLLRELLGRTLGTTPRTVPLATGPNGKPRLGGAVDGSPTFGVSHSEHLLAISIRIDGRDPVGVDTELVDPVEAVSEVAERVFLPDEAARVVAAAAEGDWRAFHRYWTAKEAVLKALGTGFSLDPRALRIRTTGGDTFEVEAASTEAPALPPRGVWMSVAVPGPSEPRRSAIVALAPVGARESVEVVPPRADAADPA